MCLIATIGCADLPALQGVQLWLHALQEFDSSEAAAAVMEAEHADGFQMDGCRLRLEFSASQRPGGGYGGGGGGGGFSNAAAVMDWVCDRCSTTNFARWAMRRSCSACEIWRLQGYTNDCCCLCWHMRPA